MLHDHPTFIKTLLMTTAATSIPLAIGMAILFFS
jgi:hypothetical protein